MLTHQFEFALRTILHEGTQGRDARRQETVYPDAYGLAIYGQSASAATLYSVSGQAVPTCIQCHCAKQSLGEEEKM